MLHLSDGGHFENLALLPLFKRRLMKILVVNGGYINCGSQYGSALVAAMELAREILHCSFTSADKAGGDVLAEIRETFALAKKDRERRLPPRWFKFQVHYHDIDEEGNRTNAGEGEVIIISPRHPSKGATANSVTWEECKVTIDPEMWGEGPVVSSEEADNLTGCCCECCHGCCCNIKDCCGVFPHHVTANQLFTPKMFSAYHREGYRACRDALAALDGDEFFNAKD